MIPTQFTTFSLSTIVGSAILYRDFEGVGLPSLVNFVFGCLICAAGELGGLPDLKRCLPCTQR